MARPLRRVLHQLIRHQQTLDGAEWSLYEDTQATQDGKCTYNKRGRKTVKLNWKDQKMCIIKGRNNILLRQTDQALKIANGIRGPGQPSTAHTALGTPNAGPGGALVSGNVLNVNANAMAINIHLANGNSNALPVFPTTTAPQPPQPAAAPAPVLTPPILTPSASTTPLASTSSFSFVKIQPIELPCPSEAQCTYNRSRCSQILTRWGTAGFLNFYDEQHSVSLQASAKAVWPDSSGT